MALARPALGIVLIAALAAAAIVPTRPTIAGPMPVVVELFTSQGCNSCPPADALLGELALRDDVIALSIHVDYWDYIGWKDPFASPAHTLRQQVYARLFGLRYVYTPQMVVNGVRQMTGGDRRAVLAAIDAAKGTEGVEIRLARNGQDEIAVGLPRRGGGDEATVWLVVLDREHTTEIKRGENKGRTLSNRNVVRAFQRIGTWRNEAVDFSVALSEIAPQGGDDCAVLVQSQRDGRMLGAVRLALTR